MLRRTLVTLTGALCCGAAVRAQPRPVEMLLYCGITMVRPMIEIAQLFEQRQNVTVRIAQGGSEDLYQSARKSGAGDWYLPGEPSYRVSHLQDGLLGDFVIVGYNQIALMVQKGNPKKVWPDAREVLRPDLRVILGNAESGSVGHASKAALDALGIYPRAVKASVFLAPDSRSLVNAMKRDEADLTLIWRATGFFPENAGQLDVIDIDPRIARPQPLLLTLLKTSAHKALAREFMALAAGQEGQAVFRKYGFLDNRTLTRQELP